MHIRILLVEDSLDDADLVIREIRRNGYDVFFEQIQSAGEMKKALAEKEWDAIICDYSLPQFDAMQALAMLHESGLDLPFIIVSGTISEENAVTALKAGAHDFLIKGKYARLGPAIVREMRDAEIRRGRKRAEAELKQRNAELERLYRASEGLFSGGLVDLPSLARTIVTTVLQEFQQSNCSLLLVNNETRELERIAVEGPYSAEVSKSNLSLDGPGLIAKAIHGGNVINIAEVSTEVDYVPNWEDAHSELVIPLKVGGEVIGALDVQSPERGAFHEDDERLMTIFADRAAMALERTRLYEQTIRQLERLAALRVIDLAISNSFDLRLTLSTVLDQVVEQLRVDAASILLFKPETGRLEFALGRGFRTRGIEASSLRPGEGYAGTVALERRIVQIPNISDFIEQFTRRQLLEGENFISYFGVPLITKGELKGVLEIFHRSPLKTDMEWLNFLDSLGWQTAIAVDNAMLFEKIQRSNFELGLAYDATIEGWSHAMDLRDKETEGHTRRVTEMTLKFARVMGVPEAEITHVRRGALLHDIGKMGVPDSILLKPDKLTDEEWQVMRRHPQYAYDMLASITYLRPALDIPYCHHEKWDGTGYPRGLAGTQIPLTARLFAVVDVWDAITSDRPYRKKWSRQQALDYIREQSGKHFDPEVVGIFLREIVDWH